MEYRKGKSLQVHTIKNYLVDLTVNETTEAFRINGVTLSKARISRCRNPGTGPVTIEVLYEYLMLAFKIGAKRLLNTASDDVKYLHKKTPKVFKALGVETEADDAALTIALLPYVKHAADGVKSGHSVLKL